jgi:hypothetical protein
MTLTASVYCRGGRSNLVLFCSLNKTFQNMLDFISFFPWVKSDVVALWGNMGRTWIWSSSMPSIGIQYFP